MVIRSMYTAGYRPFRRSTSSEPIGSEFRTPFWTTDATDAVGRSLTCPEAGPSRGATHRFEHATDTEFGWSGRTRKTEVWWCGWEGF